MRVVPSGNVTTLFGTPVAGVLKPLTVVGSVSVVGSNVGRISPFPIVVGVSIRIAPSGPNTVVSTADNTHRPAPASNRPAVLRIPPVLVGRIPGTGILILP